MIKPDQRQRIRRIHQLQLAADVIEALRKERPELVALYVHHDICQQLRTLAEQYEAKPLAPVLRMHDEQRPSLPRVAMSKRRTTLKLGGKMREIPINPPEDPLGMTRALRDIQEGKDK